MEDQLITTSNKINNKILESGKYINDNFAAQYRNSVQANQPEISVKRRLSFKYKPNKDTDHKSRNIDKNIDHLVMSNDQDPGIELRKRNLSNYHVRVIRGR